MEHFLMLNTLCVGSTERPMLTEVLMLPDMNCLREGRRPLNSCHPRRTHLLHVKRADYQAKIWLQADKSHMDLSDLTENGALEEKNGHLEIVWKRITSVPEFCKALVTCQCKSSCRTKNCQCQRSGQGFIPACKCMINGLCLNPFTNE